MVEENGTQHLNTLPALLDPARTATPASSLLMEAGPAETAVPLSQYLWILKRHRWRILAAIAISVIATAVVSLRLTPIYESTATIDIDRRIPPPSWARKRCSRPLTMPTSFWLRK